MKHLKSYNESLDGLQYFCETSLAYLIDKDYKVVANISQYSTKGIISFKQDSNNFFDWDDIKDHYIPFLQMLQKRYKLLPWFAVTFHSTGSKTVEKDFINFNLGVESKYFSVEDVISDDFTLNDIKSINLKI